MTQGRDLLQVCFSIKQLGYCNKANMKVVCPFVFIDCVQPSFYHEESSSRPHYHTFGEKESGIEWNTNYSRKRTGKTTAKHRTWPCASPNISSKVLEKSYVFLREIQKKSNLILLRGRRRIEFFVRILILWECFFIIALPSVLLSSSMVLDKIQPLSLNLDINKRDWKI